MAPDGVDIPSPTMAMVDPKNAAGRIRVELKPYKKNQGDVPYFIITQTSAWYQVFIKQYYEQLWNDSPVVHR